MARSSRRAIGSIRKLPSGRYSASVNKYGYRIPGPHTFDKYEDADEWCFQIAKKLWRIRHTPGAQLKVAEPLFMSQQAIAQATGSIDYQLTSGKPYSYQLVATDFAGNIAQSQVTNATVDCTKKKCYVGATWNVKSPQFGATIKLPNAQLQQLVKNKWVTITAAPQIKRDGLLTYNLKYTPKKAGTFTYRIYIPPSPKWAAFIGKSFKQRVIG